MIKAQRDKSAGGEVERRVITVSFRVSVPEPFGGKDEDYPSVVQIGCVGQDKGGALSGRSIKADKVRVDSIMLGSIRFPFGEAASRDYNGNSNNLKIDGILCFGPFSKYYLTLDYPAKRVRLEVGELPKPDGNETLALRLIYKGVPFTWRLPFIETRVVDFSFKAFIDSGFNADSFLFP
jgi:hypothetical protein